MPKYVLSYFNVRARAEFIRYIFAVGGLEYTDHRISEDWATLKKEQPLGQVPVLDVDGVKIPQSYAIARFVAREAKLAGRNNIEQAQADAVIDSIVDLNNAFDRIYESEDEAVIEAARVKFHAEVAPEIMKNIEKLISMYGKPGFSVGDEITWADIALFKAFDVAKIEKGKYHVADKVVETVQNNPRMINYLQTRPHSDY